MPDATQTLNLLIKASNKEAKAAFKDLGLSVTAVVGALYAATKAYEKFVAPVIQYNKEIKDASESTGMAVDQLSRFVQVGDDMGVSMESITRALELATKNGFAPTIDSLAELADRGNAMGSVTERAALYTELFGRRWAELNPILELGGDKIREIAAAQADGLVVTEETYRKTEALRLRLDSLNDSYIALRNEVVLSIIPVVDLNFRATEMTNTWARMQEEMTGLKPTFFEYQAQWHLIEEAIRGAEGVTETGIVQLGILRQAAKDAIPAVDGITQSLLDERWAAMGAAEETDKLNRFLDYCKNQHIYPTIELFITWKHGGNMGVAGGGFGSGPAGSGSSAPSGDTIRDYRPYEQGGGLYRIDPATGRRERIGAAQGGQIGSVLVGEHGAERFTPGTAGTVSPANDPLVRAINHMVRQLPVILRDAVQKA